MLAFRKDKYLPLSVALKQGQHRLRAAEHHRLSLRRQFMFLSSRPLHVTVLVFVAFHNSHSLGADAGCEGAEDAAATGDSERDPGDEVVDVHEVAGAVLVKGTISSDLSFIGEGINFIESFGHVTGGERASSVESPDHAGDPPGEATATGTGHAEAHEAGTNARGEHSAEGGEDTSGAGEKGLDEAPKEPSDKLAVDIVESLTSKGTFRFGAEKSGLSLEFAVPSLFVGVGESVFAEVGDKGDDCGAAG